MIDIGVTGHQRDAAAALNHRRSMGNVLTLPKPRRTVAPARGRAGRSRRRGGERRNYGDGVDGPYTVITKFDITAPWPG